MVVVVVSAVVSLTYVTILPGPAVVAFALVVSVLVAAGLCVDARTSGAFVGVEMAIASLPLRRTRAVIAVHQVRTRSAV